MYELTYKSFINMDCASLLEQWELYAPSTIYAMKFWLQFSCMFDGSVFVVCLPEGAVITALEGCKIRIRTHYEPT